METWGDVASQVHWTDLAIAGVIGILMSITIVVLINWDERNDASESASNGDEGEEDR